MSGRFVSGGTIGASGEEGEAPQAREPLVKQTVGVIPGSVITSATGARAEPKKNAEWEAVEKELEADRRRREEARAKAAQGEERSLYDVLQANKAAKQAAFDEQNKLSNQFQTLNDDDIEFLDEVQAKKKKEEERQKQEMEEGLKAFRTRQKVDEGTEASAVAEDTKNDEWTVGKKRKRVPRERDGIKVRRKSTDNETAKDEVEVEEKPEVKQVTVDEKKPSVSLGLGDYGSDSDE